MRTKNVKISALYCIVLLRAILAINKLLSSWPLCSQYLVFGRSSTTGLVQAEITLTTPCTQDRWRTVEDKKHGFISSIKTATMVVFWLIFACSAKSERIFHCGSINNRSLEALTGRHFWNRVQFIWNLVQYTFGDWERGELQTSKLCQNCRLE